MYLLPQNSLINLQEISFELMFLLHNRYIVSWLCTRYAPISINCKSVALVSCRICTTGWSSFRLLFPRPTPSTVNHSNPFRLITLSNILTVFSLLCYIVFTLLRFVSIRSPQHIDIICVNRLWCHIFSLNVTYSGSLCLLLSFGFSFC